MHPIDQVQLNFNPLTLNILNVILGLIVFGVSLDIKVSDFKEIARNPKPFAIGVLCQFLIFPAITFLTIYLANPLPSLGLGMILVAACPGGNISNFMTQFARGNAALSISMSAFSTAVATVMTPFNIAFWGSKIKGADTILTQVSLDPVQMFYLITVLMLIPLTLGITLAHKFPEFANRLKKIMKTFSLLFFAAFVIFAIIANFNYMIDYIGRLVGIVIGLNAIAFLVRYSVSTLVGLDERNKRAVAIETGIQNSGLGLILIFNFFDGLGGMAMIAALWGVWHIISGLLLASYWNKKLITA